MRKYGKVPGAGVGWVTSSRPQVPCGNMVPGAGGLASRRRQVPRGTVAKSQGLGGDQFQSVKTGWG